VAHRYRRNEATSRRRHIRKQNTSIVAIDAIEHGKTSEMHRCHGEKSIRALSALAALLEIGASAQVPGSHFRKPGRKTLSDTVDALVHQKPICTLGQSHCWFRRMKIPQGCQGMVNGDTQELKGHKLCLKPDVPREE
jgi:hypothetical protein